MSNGSLSASNNSSKSNEKTSVVPVAISRPYSSASVHNAKKTPHNPLFKNIRNWVSGVLGIKTQDGNLKETLDELAEENESESLVVTAEGKDMLQNILSFFDLRVEDVMIPRIKIVAVEERTTLDELKAVIREQEHTRMPVYSNSIDNITGFIHIKDLIRYNGHDSDFRLKDFVRDILIVPQSMRILDLLVKMRLSGVHIATVVDEFGSTDGLVTLEDIFEEIVGDIQDEHDEIEESQNITKISDNCFDADARLEVDNLEKIIGMDINGEDERSYDTLAGLIFEEIGRVPSIGEIIETKNRVTFEILDADPTRIKRVRVTLLKDISGA